jgi:hypothetical protein
LRKLSSATLYRRRVLCDDASGTLKRITVAIKRDCTQHIMPTITPIYYRVAPLRLGAYGDPAAVPFEVFEPLVRLSSVHTGYTHQIAHRNFDRRYLLLCQVSADTPKQALKYQAQGAKTFRVALPDDTLFDNEIECLSDSKGIQCIDCGLCDGQSKNIAIVVHGQRKNNFKSNLIQTVEVA